MAERKINYLLGIDGGGTKTEFLLTDLNENEIRRTFLGASNPVNIGVDKTKEILLKGITEVCEGLDLSEISVFAGLAGGGTGDIKTELTGYLGSFGFGAYANGRDTDSLVEIALKGENGVAVIMGTGMIAYSSCNGELHRVGGRGYLIDRGGSGFHLGADALNACFEYIDGRGGSALILELVEKKLGKSVEAAVPEIYANGATMAASLAPAVFEAYKQGDDTAREILDRNTREVAKVISTALKYVEGESKTVICGGLCKQQDILKPFLLNHLGDINLIFSDEPMVNGAVSLAKANI
ncbi:MAG: BadF/BadG/BcrA/BcrD ATPase family protein [Acutalibacteraceae bacterium]|nr:BadF/BadG/BcrA/BcrD ATPase family protein [Acutalibacteraceae bacterium]